MKNKKLISVLLSVVLALSMITNAGMIVLADAISFEYDEPSGTITVTGSGDMQDYNENNLASRPWNEYIDSARRVVIGDGVTHIGDYAFSRFSSLEEVVIPESVTSIGKTAFSGNDLLKSIIVPSTVTDIGAYAFGYAYDMTVPSDFVAYCEYKSAAQAYCLQNYIPFDAPMSGNSATAWITEGAQQAMWSFCAKTNGTLEFWSTGTKDTYGLIYDASNYVYNASYAEMRKSAIVTGDDNGSDVNFRITLNVEAGKRYYLAAKFMLNDRYDGSSANEDGRFGVGMRITCSEHSYEEVSRLDSTCTMHGEVIEECIGCGDTRTTTLELADHSPAQAVRENVVEASCTQEGSYDLVEYCDYCHAELSRVAKTEPMRNHQFGEYVVTPADCTNNETRTATCIYCGETDTTMVPDTALGHSFTNYVSNNDADCIHNGTETAKCDRCDETDTRIEENSALGHEYEVEVISATCTDSGYTLHTCTRCNDSYTSDFQDALGHIDGEEESEILLEPTCTAVGKKLVTIHCERCGVETFSGERFIEMLGHDFEIKTFDGEVVGVDCSRCDETKTFDFMFRYNTEIVENDDWAIIDVNSDGVINAKDYAMIYRMTK